MILTKRKQYYRVVLILYNSISQQQNWSFTQTPKQLQYKPIHQHTDYFTNHEIFVKNSFFLKLLKRFN